MPRKIKHRLLIVDDERNTREVLEKFLKIDYNITLAEDGKAGLDILKKSDFDIVLTDMQMPGANGLDILEFALNKDNPCPVIMFTAYGSVNLAVEAMKKGAYDFITKPINFDQLEMMLKRAVESGDLKKENKRLKKELKEKSTPNNIVGKSVAMLEVIELIKQIATSKTTVLITGESGTGKELVAQAIHNYSGRKGRMVPVHCAALSDTLLESELFGHEKGAFTGAVEARKGRFELADGGTIFLDEIGEIDLSTQVKLLRVLETKSFERVGGINTVKVDTRVLAATNRDLEEMVNNGEFREDLYYRLNVINIKVPPLRDRKEDIPLLVKYYIDQFASENEKNIEGITEESLNVLTSYDWKGNIRELKNCIERMVVLSRSELLDIANIPINIRNAVGDDGNIPLNFSTTGLDLQGNEKMLIIQALKESNGNRTHAAKKLGISRRTLHRKLNLYNLT